MWKMIRDLRWDMDRAKSGAVMRREMARTMVKMPWSKDEEHEGVKDNEDDEESEG